MGIINKILNKNKQRIENEKLTNIVEEFDNLGDIESTKKRLKVMIENGKKGYLKTY